MLSKLRPAEWLTTLGVILLFASTFKPWFELSGIDGLGKMAPDAQLIGGKSTSVNLNVWDLSVTRWFIYLALIVSAWMVIAALFSETPRWALVFNTPASMLSFLAATGMVIRLINPPGDASITTAYGVAVAGVLLLFAGMAWAQRDETVPDAYLQSPVPEHVRLDA
jgi:hypothetical protein